MFVRVANESKRPVNVAVFDLGDDWAIRAIEPRPPDGHTMPTRDAAAHDALFRLREALDADENTEREVRPRSAPGEDWTARHFRIVMRRT
ncbi:hypothetical protein [Sorangium sp. So ce388]|uniref:hypothetical protein n=1 Tax=Sorangium sp. So ce388 TaxID=3133309 RepID=UPI003F5B3AD2